MKRSGDRNLALGREGMLSAHREWGERGLEGNPPTIHGALDTHFQFLIFSQPNSQSPRFKGQIYVFWCIPVVSPSDQTGVVSGK